MNQVILLVSRLRPCGPINQTLNLATALRGYGIETLVVTLFPEVERTYLQRYREQDVEVVCLKSHPLRLWKACQQLIRILTERETSVLHSTGFYADFVCSRIKFKCLKITTIRSHIEDIGEESNPLYRRLCQFLWKRAVRNIDARVCCSEHLFSAMQSVLGSNGLYCIQNGVDIDRFVPATGSRKIRLRDHYNLPSSQRLYCSISILEPRKNNRILVRCFRQLQNENCCLLIVGGGSEYDTLRTEAEGCPNIIVLGEVPDPRPYYQLSDIFISASFAEGLPNSVMEALSCGMPVLLSNIGPHQELLSQGSDAGRLFIPDDESDILRALQGSMSWNIEYKGTVARQVVVDHLSKYRTAEQYANLYRQLL